MVGDYEWNPLRVPQQLVHDLVDVLESISDIYPTCMSEVNIYYINFSEK